MQHRPVPLENIYTAAQAQVAYLVSAVPYGARVFVISGNSHGPLEDSFWMQLLRQKDGPRVSSWDVRTYLSESEAKEWAAAAAAAASPAEHANGGTHGHGHGAAGEAAAAAGRCGVFVVLFSDGDISACHDPRTGELGFADWSFDVIKKASSISRGISHISLHISHGAPSATPRAQPATPYVYSGELHAVARRGARGHGGGRLQPFDRP